MLIYKHDDNIVSRKIGGEVILVPIRTAIADMNFLYTLNTTAGRIWQLLDGVNNDLEDVHRQICREFEIDPHEAKTDLDEIIQDLIRIGAITQVSSV